MKKITKLNLNILLICIGLAVLTTLLTIVITTGPLFISSVSALTYQDSVDLDFTFNPALNLTITGGDLNIDGITPGNYHDSNIITVTSGSNSVTGYTLYANVGSNTIDYTDLRISSNNANAANIFTSLSSNKGTLASFDGGTWGYSYSTDAGTTWISGDFDDPNVSSHTGYNGLPLYSGNGGVKLAKTTAPSNPSTIQFKIGAKAANEQVAGTYTNTVNFISVGNVVTTSYTMNYVDTSNEATNMPSNPTTGTTTDGIFTLTNTVPLRTDYQFKGWCTVNNSNNPTTCTDGTNTGSIIQPGKQYVIGSTATNFTGTVYAVWATGYMQNISLDTLAALMPNVGDTTSLIDSRDEQAYTIAKLADGKYWMTKNLNLAGGTALTANDTDISPTYISNFTTSNNLTKDNTNNAIILPSSSTSGFDTDNYSYVYNTGNKTDNCANPGCYSYYSWDAATLGSGRDIAAENTDAPYSICPKGWRLPTSGISSNDKWKQGDFYMLATAYGANLDSKWYDDSVATGKDFYANAGPNTIANFLPSGYYYDNAFYDGDSRGLFWSSNNNSGADALGLGFSPSIVSSAGNNYRRDGFSIRCLYQPTMQNINKTDLATLMPNTHDSTTLRDSRDNQDYTVAKLADGKYWMTKNLNIAGETILSSADTDVSADYISNFSTSNNLTKSGNTLVLPASSTTGFDTDNYSYVYNSGNTTNCGASGQDTPCFSYYSWDAATLGSGRDITTQNTDAPYSVCPENWRLPTTGSTSDSGWKRGDFYALATAYGVNLENYWYNSSSTFYNNIGPSTIPNYILSGYINVGSFSAVGTYGYYWSATSSNSTTFARTLSFSSGYLSTSDYYSRSFGFFIRCLFRD